MSNNIKKESYLVEGMTCSGCERAIQRIVSNLEGVESAKADLQSSTVYLEYDAGKVNIERIKSAINKIGYKIVGERPPFGQKEGRDDAVS
jgi:mercuric ion transport protein